MLNVLDKLFQFQIKLYSLLFIYFMLPKISYFKCDFSVLYDCVMEVVFCFVFAIV